MSETSTYTCKNCGKSRELSTDETIPVCCDNTMKPASALPVCEASFTAEHSRADDDGEPCDDGRAG